MEKKSRDKSLDYLKGILTILMVLAHCVQFFGDESEPVGWILSNYINLTTFSGFMFVFGAVSYHAYFTKEFKHVAKNMAMNILKTLFAFYLSSFAFFVFRTQILFLPDQILDILFIKKLAGWSEFLISFSAIMILAMVLFKLMKNMTPLIFTICSVLSLASTFLPYDKIKNPIIGIFIGSKDVLTFPVVQYFIYFAFGVFASKFFVNYSRKLNLIVLVITAALSAPCLGYMVANHSLPMRFPPNIIFILGGMFFVFTYYLISRGLMHAYSMVTDNTSLGFKSKLIIIPLDWLSLVGSNSLLFLLLSNILIFTISSSMFHQRTPLFVGGLWVFLLIVITYFISLVRKNRTLKQNTSSANTLA